MSTRAHGKAAFIFIFITIALDMLALGLIVPVLPKLVLQFEGGDMAKAASITGVFGTMWALMQFIFSPVLGSLSDRFGRRPVVLLSNFGLGLDYILMALAPTVMWLFVGRVISGITAASYSTAAAYMADVTPPEERAKKFGMLGAAFGLGFIIGPALGGVLGSIDLRLPFWVAGGLSLANACYGYFILPESLPPERRSKFEWKKANPIGSLKLIRSHPGLTALATAIVFSFLAHEAYPSIWVLYVTQKYAWTESGVGLSLALTGIASTIVQAVLVGKFVKKLGEPRAMIFGYVMGAIGFIVYAFAPTTSLFYIGIPFGALWGVAAPAATATMSRWISPSEQGQLQGALQSLRGVTGLIGPILFTQVFAASVRNPDGFVGAPFFMGGILLLVSALVSWLSTRKASAEVRA